MPREVKLTVVRTGGTVVVQEPTQEEAWITSLLADRAAYIQTGNTHLIPGIDETLAFHGYEGELPAYDTNGGQ